MAGTKFSLLGFCALQAVQNSPCSASVLCERYKILPADAFWAKTAVFSRAGRVLYRQGRVAPGAGRVLYRDGCLTVVAGRVLYRQGCATVVVGRIMYRGGRLVMPLVSLL